MRESHWQRIATAPKDGEQVLLWFPEKDLWEAACWDEDAEVWCEPGRECTVFDPDNIWKGVGEATHWLRPTRPKTGMSQLAAAKPLSTIDS